METRRWAVADNGKVISEVLTWIQSEHRRDIPEARKHTIPGHPGKWTFVKGVCPLMSPEDANSERVFDPFGCPVRPGLTLITREEGEALERAEIAAAESDNVEFDGLVRQKRIDQRNAKRAALVASGMTEEQAAILT